MASATDGPDLGPAPPTHGIVGGIYYTGRKYAQIGAVVSSLVNASMDLTPEVKLTRSSLYGQFTVRIFF